ncbi:MAG: glycosyltransferase family 39 protein, partial [Phycisphaeraceae bacterium]|nr:glycosyltransferase family 39 protein [Phycisphaeraceae bacterium]
MTANDSESEFENPTESAAEASVEPNRSASAAPEAGPVLRWVERKRWWIFAAIVLWWIFGFNGQWRVGADSVFHATVARNLIEGKGFTHGPFHPVNVQPGLPYLIAGGYLLTDTETIWPAIAAVFAMGLGVLVVVFHWAKLAFGRPVAVVVTAMVGMNSLLMEFSYSVLTDVPFLLGFMLLLLGLERLRTSHGRTALSVGFLAAGVVVMGLFRSAVIVVVAAAAVGAVGWALKKQNRPHLKWVLGCLGGGAVGLLVVRLADPHQHGLLHPDEAQALRTLASNLPHQLPVALPQNILIFVQEALPSASVGMQLGAVAGWATFCVIFVPHAVVLVRRRPLWALLYAAVSVPFLLFFIAPRHLLPLTPILAAGWWMLGAEARRRWPRAGLGILACLLVIWFSLNFLRGGDLILYQRQKPFAEKYKDGRPAVLMDLGRTLRDKTESDAVLIMLRPGVEAVAFTARRDGISDQRLRAHPAEMKKQIGDRP